MSSQSTPPEKQLRMRGQHGAWHIADTQRFKKLMMPAMDQRRGAVPDMLSVLGDFKNSLSSNSCQHNSQEERTAINSGLKKTNKKK